MNIKGKARFLGYHVFNKCYSFFILKEILFLSKFHENHMRLKLFTCGTFVSYAPE